MYKPQNNSLIILRFEYLFVILQFYLNKNSITQNEEGR